jgi:hypothetical protein
MISSMSKIIGRFRSEFLLILLVLVGILAAWTLKIATPYGLGLRNDSVQYIFGARNLLAGNGYMRTSGGGELKPITTVPPLFSSVIAVVSLSGLEPIRAAKVLNLGLFGLDVILLGYLIFRLTHSIGFSLAGAILFGFSSDILESFAWLMSEPLFFFTWLVSFILFDLYITTRRKVWLILLGLICGAAYLTRYIGASLPVTFAFVLLVFERRWKSKLIALAWFLLPFLPFVVGWAMRNTHLIGNPANRSLQVHIATPEKIQFGIQNFWDWLLPAFMKDFQFKNEIGFQVAFYVILVLALSGLVVWFTRDLHWLKKAGGEKGFPSSLLVVGLYAFIYPAMTLLSMSFIDASTILDHRLLIPFYISILILCMAGLSSLFIHRSILIRILAVGVLLVSLGLGVKDDWVKVKQLSQSGLGFDSPGVTLSPTIAYIERMPPTIIYTNKAYMVYIVTGRMAYMVTGSYDPVTMVSNVETEEAYEIMRQAVQAEEAVLIYFKDEAYGIDPWFLKLTKGLHPIEEYSDGIIFKGSE